MSISDSVELKLLDKVLRGVDFDVAAVFVKLHTGDPGEAGTANPAGETTRKVVTFAAPSAGACASNVDVGWTLVSTNETYSHASLWDAVTGGECLWTGPLDEAKIVLAGDSRGLSPARGSASGWPRRSSRRSEHCR